MSSTLAIPQLYNSALQAYVRDIEARYPAGEFYKEEKRDSGRGEGPSLLITVCQDGDILEEEDFLYGNATHLCEDLENLSFYLDFS
jgi:hypothetical protein